MFTATRTRDDVAADLAVYKRRASRMVCVNGYCPVTHAIIDDLLDEMQRMGWHVPPTPEPDETEMDQT